MITPTNSAQPDTLQDPLSILGDCFEERKEFYFQCETEDDADELIKAVRTLVFQINDRWKVYLDGLILKSSPP